MKQRRIAQSRTALLVMLFAGAGVSSAADLAEMTADCDSCHGKDGASQESSIPTIAGQSAQYIIDSFTAYSDKTRPCKEVEYVSGPHKGEKSDMCKAGENLSAADVKQLAEHYSAKPFVRAKQSFDAAQADKGKKVHALYCKKCHEDGGSSPEDDSGILAGQWMPYMREQFEAFSAGKREMTKKMKAKYEKLSQDEIEALLHFYASAQ